MQRQLEELLTMNELCQKLKKTRSGIDDLIKRRIIPVIRLGRSLRFKQSDVEAALSRMTVRAV